MAKSFYDLSEKDILALAISLEEEDDRIYGGIRRENAVHLSKDCRYSRRYARRGIRSSSSVDRELLPEIRRLHPVAPQARCERVCESKTDLVEPDSDSRTGPERNRFHGTGNQAVLRGRGAKIDQLGGSPTIK